MKNCNIKKLLLLSIFFLVSGCAKSPEELKRHEEFNKMEKWAIKSNMLNPHTPPFYKVFIVGWYLHMTEDQRNALVKTASKLIPMSGFNYENNIPIAIDIVGVLLSEPRQTRENLVNLTLRLQPKNKFHWFDPCILLKVLERTPLDERKTRVEQVELFITSEMDSVDIAEIFITLSNINPDQITKRIERSLPIIEKARTAEKFSSTTQETDYIKQLLKTPVDKDIPEIKGKASQVISGVFGSLFEANKPRYWQAKGWQKKGEINWY